MAERSEWDCELLRRQSLHSCPTQSRPDDSDGNAQHELPFPMDHAEAVEILNRLYVSEDDFEAALGRLTEFLQAGATRRLFL